MIATRYLSGGFAAKDAMAWARRCAHSIGWAADEAEELAAYVTDSALAVSKSAYQRCERGPVFVKLDLRKDAVTLELHHEGAISDKPCTCAAARIAVAQHSTYWTDAHLRSHALEITRTR